MHNMWGAIQRKLQPVAAWKNGFAQSVGRERENIFGA
jgi:hypothetical protein